MKIDGVIIEDSKTGQFFTFIRQFPGICAQGDSVESATIKVNQYFQKYIEKMSNQEVDMDDSQIISM